MYVDEELMKCKSVCEVKSIIDSLFRLGHEQKMLSFSQVLKPIKWWDLLKEGKTGRNAFRTDAKIQLSETHKRMESHVRKTGFRLFQSDWSGLVFR